MFHYFGKHLKVRSCQIRTTRSMRKNLSIPSVPRGSLWCDQCVVRHYNAKTTLPSKMASKITLPKSQNMVTIALHILWPWYIYIFFFFFYKGNRALHIRNSACPQTLTAHTGFPQDGFSTDRASSIVHLFSMTAVTRLVW